jgi:formylglycine-generating enzyme required for sulfatase activity
MKQILLHSLFAITMLLPSALLAQEDTTESPYPVIQNDDWTPIIQEFDGVEMVLVPPGCFMMGSTDEEIDAAFEMCEQSRGQGICRHPWFEIESPVHEVCFDEPFWIDRYEVSNAQFVEFDGVAEEASTHRGDDLPREQIIWFEARDFCDLRGMRLPSEVEWEYAARGPDSLVFPWGDEFDGVKLNFCDENCEFDSAAENYDDGYANTAPVGSYEEGVSWVGAYDMSGNVWEFTSTIFDPVNFPYPYVADDGRESDEGDDGDHVLRGGSWLYNDAVLRAANRFFGGPDDRGHDAGVRCARDYDQDGE